MGRDGLKKQPSRPDGVLRVSADEPMVALEQQGRSPVCVPLSRRSESFVEEPLGAVVRVGREDPRIGRAASGSAATSLRRAATVPRERASSRS